MVTVAVCEDEPRLRADLTHRLRSRLDTLALPARIVSFSSGEALLDAPASPDVVFMDIRLGGTDGLSVVRRLRREGRPCQAVFLTAYPQHVFDAFDLDAVHYLLKPVDDGALFHALDRALSRLTPDRGPILSLPGPRFLSLDQILCCEVLDHTLTVHTPSASLDYPGALRALENELDGRFFRCHKSYLVNLDYVRALEGDGLVLCGGMRVPVSRRRRRALGERLLDRVRMEVV